MSTWRTVIPSEVWAMIEESDLTGPEAFTLIALRHFADGQGRGARPSHQRLARMMKFCPRTIRAAIVGLEAKGFLERRRHPGRCDEYILLPRQGMPRQEMPSGKSCRTPRQEMPDTPAGAAYDQDPGSGSSDQDPGVSAREEKDLLSRYNGSKQTILSALAEVAETRKRRRVAPSVRVKILRRLDQYPVAAVLEGCGIYTRKHYGRAGKAEGYLAAICRGCAREREAKDASKPQKGIERWV
ncbi:MAG: hypothetical protein JXR96_04870 [Deltaproteobacteria bacterium]|nr:hypothetical protein [Deltaproteobacteria bacterium]